MIISVLFRLAVTPSKGEASMSDWVNKEASKLKELLATKKVKDEKFVLEQNIKLRQGFEFWDSTRQATKRIAAGINEQLGERLLEYATDKPEQFKLSAPSFGTKAVCNARYEEKTFTLRYNSPASGSNHEMILDVDKSGHLIWKEKHGSSFLSTEQMAERITEGVSAGW